VANECSVYYKQAIDSLIAAGIKEPADFFWAGVFAGICEQVMMKVKPAGMIGSDMPHAEEATRLIAEVYRLHRERLDKPTGGFEVWVCRKDDEEALLNLKRLQSGGLDWAEYHALRGRLCGYTDDMIHAYTEGIWP